MRALASRGNIWNEEHFEVVLDAGNGRSDKRIIHRLLALNIEREGYGFTVGVDIRRSVRGAKLTIRVDRESIGGRREGGVSGVQSVAHPGIDGAARATARRRRHSESPEDRWSRLRDRCLRIVKS